MENMAIKSPICFGLWCRTGCRCEEDLGSVPSLNHLILPINPISALQFWILTVSYIKKKKCGNTVLSFSVYQNSAETWFRNGEQAEISSQEPAGSGHLNRFHKVFSGQSASFEEQEAVDRSQTITGSCHKHVNKGGSSVDAAMLTLLSELDNASCYGSRPLSCSLPPFCHFGLCILWTLPRGWCVCIARTANRPAFHIRSLIGLALLRFIQLRSTPSAWLLIGAATNTPVIALQRSAWGNL